MSSKRLKELEERLDCCVKLAEGNAHLAKENAKWAKHYQDLVDYYNEEAEKARGEISRIGERR